MTNSATARDTKMATNSATDTGTSKMVTGLFANSESVERAYAIVSQRGYGTEDINVVMSDDTRRPYFSDDRQINTELGRKVEEGGEMGGPRGGQIGTIIPAADRGRHRGSSRRGPGARGAGGSGTGGRGRRRGVIRPYGSVARLGHPGRACQRVSKGHPRRRYSRGSENALR